MTETSLIGFSRGTDQGNQFQAVNPSTGQNLSVQYAHASQEEVERACQLAESASCQNWPLYLARKKQIFSICS